MLSHSRSRGAFAGVSFEGSTLRPDGDANRKLYGRKLRLRKLSRSQSLRAGSCSQLISFAEGSPTLKHNQKAKTERGSGISAPSCFATAPTALLGIEPTPPGHIGYERKIHSRVGNAVNLNWPANFPEGCAGFRVINLHREGIWEDGCSSRRDMAGCCLLVHSISLFTKPTPGNETEKQPLYLMSNS
jgi:hypothetical protein